MAFWTWDELIQQLNDMSIVLARDISIGNLRPEVKELAEECFDICTSTVKTIRAGKGAVKLGWTEKAKELFDKSEAEIRRLDTICKKMEA